MEHLLYKHTSRREFIKQVCVLGAGIAVSPFICQALAGAKTLNTPLEGLGLHEAMYYTKMDEETVQCELCPHRCVIRNGTRSFCRVREPIEGKLYTLVYQLPCAVHVDPIEKKPLFHMLPGSLSFSIATAGCNSRCKYCQNWQISQSRPEDTINSSLSCEDTVGRAQASECRSIAYTYSEPTIFYEYMIDTAKLAKAKGIKNISVTAGYINPEPLSELCEYLDASNVDLKAYDDKYLKEVCAESLQPILEGLMLMRQKGVWVEVTNLVVPTLNDDMDTIRQMCAWIRENLGADTPLHFSRFWPMYKLKNLPPTPVSTLEQARDVALSEGLHYVYIGNVPGHEGNNTFCPRCKKLLVRRRGYLVFENNISKAKCIFCDQDIAGIWE